MRTLLIALLGIFAFTQIAIAATNPAKITRITLSASDKIEYETRFLDEPPCLVLRFKTPNIFGRLIDDIKINQGAIKNVEVVYYPAEYATDSRRIKFLTFYLAKGTSYKIWDNGNEIFLDFKNPSIKAAQASNLVNLKDGGIGLVAADKFLSHFASMPRPSVTKSGPQDMLWVLAFMLTAVYIMWFRPEAWRRFVENFVSSEAASREVKEKRRWWRHSLLPLRDKNIYVKINSRGTNADLRLLPRDLGYGGLSFECSRNRIPKGLLDIRLFMPYRPMPIELKGNIMWQRNSWNPLRRRVGVSFVNPPDKDWAGIHNYIEQQYAALKTR